MNLQLGFVDTCDKVPLLPTVTVSVWPCTELAFNIPLPLNPLFRWYQALASAGPCGGHWSSTAFFFLRSHTWSFSITSFSPEGSYSHLSVRLRRDQAKKKKGSRCNDDLTIFLPLLTSLHFDSTTTTHHFCSWHLRALALLNPHALE